MNLIYFSLSLEPHEITLKKGEVITDVFARSGWMVDNLKFTTNFGNVYGPYGGDEDNGGSIGMCTPNTKRTRYLHSFKGVTSKKCGIVHMSFRWITFDERCMDIKESEFW